MPKQHPQIKAALAIMPDVRLRLLEQGPGDQRLTFREMRHGWHFCIEFDFLCTPGEQLDKQGCCAFCGFDKRKVPKGRAPTEAARTCLISVLARRAAQ